MFLKGHTFGVLIWTCDVKMDLRRYVDVRITRIIRIVKIMVKKGARSGDERERRKDGRRLVIKWTIPPLAAQPSCDEAELVGVVNKRVESSK